MKKIITLLLAGLMILCFTACNLGGGEVPNSDNPGTSQSGEDNIGANDNDGQTDSDGEPSLDNVTDSNYAALAKDLFGIDVDPEGDWKLVKADSTGTIAGGMGIIYQGSASVDTKEMMRAYYEATAAVSTAGICVGEVNSESSTGMRLSDPIADFYTFYEEHTSARGSVGDWIYEYGGKKIDIKFALSPDMELTLQINFVADHIYG